MPNIWWRKAGLASARGARALPPGRVAQNRHGVTVWHEFWYRMGFYRGLDREHGGNRTSSRAVGVSVDGSGGPQREKAGVERRRRLGAGLRRGGAVRAHPAGEGPGLYPG